VDRLIHSILGIVNPVLNQRIHWLWFVALQVGFGIVAGIVVSRQERIRTWQRLPLAFRSGMEASGMRTKTAGEDESRVMSRRAIFSLAVSLAGHHGLRHSRSRRGSAGDPAEQDYGLQCSLCEELFRMPWPDGKGGAAIGLAIRFISPLPTTPRSPRNADGVAGTSMPAFAQHSGGMLTDDQINVIVAEFEAAGPSRTLCAARCSALRRRLPAIRSAERPYTALTARRVTARTAMEASRPVPLWTVRISRW
jgi:hypothetical protein